MEKDLVIANLKNLYTDLSEAGEDGAPEIDLDLLFLDILKACGLITFENLADVIGREAAMRALTLVCLP
jgi:hypothetical protein